VNEKKIALNEWLMRELELPPFPYVATEKARLEAALRATQDELEKIEAEKAAAEREAESIGAKAGDYAKELLWDVVSDNVDIRLRSAAQIDDFNLEFLLGIQDNKMTSLEMVLRNLKGKATMEIVARLGQPGQQNIKVPVMHIPAVWNIPIPAGGLPLVVQVGTDFTVTVSLTAKNATLTTAGSFEFSGSAGFGQKGDAGYNKSDVQATKPVIADYKGMSLGVSAYVLGVQLPRLGVGLGMFGISSVGYADLVHVITFTNGAAAAIGLAAPPCKRITYSVVGHVGVQTELLPFKFTGSGAVANALSPQMEIHKWENILTDPPIRACDL
jgi:hypothetical protein